MRFLFWVRKDESGEEWRGRDGCVSCNKKTKIGIAFL